MEDFGVKTLSESIGILIELRYLGLRNNYIREIPHSLGALKKLEALDIDLNCMVEVPDIICEMGSICDLHMSNVIFRKPLQVDKLQNLKTLTYISIYDWTYEVSDLEERTGLQKLGIEEVDENTEVGKLCASVAKLGSLYHLILKGFRFRSMPCLDEIKRLSPRILKLEGLLARLPSADNIGRALSSLALVNTCLDEDPMLVLEKFDNLERLKLRNAYTDREMVVRDGFRMLQLLHINELWNLRKVQVGKGGMKVLKELEIKNCPRLDTLPEEIRSMKYLKKFKVVTNKTSPTIAYTPAAKQPAEQSNKEAKGNQASQKTVILPMRMGRPVRIGKKHARFMDGNFN